MAYNLTVPKLTTRDLVCPSDSAIGPDGNYTKYFESGDETHLDLQSTPTRFTVRNLDVEMQTAAFHAAEIPMRDAAKNAENPAFVRHAARLVVCGIKDAPSDWPKPLTVKLQGTGQTVLAHEILSGIGFVDLTYLVLAGQILDLEQRQLPKS